MPLQGLDRQGQKMKSAILRVLPYERCNVTLPLIAVGSLKLSQWRVEKLKSLRSQFPNRKIIIRQGDCNQILREEVIPQITGIKRNTLLSF
jgi:hypothetical protein